MAAHLLRQAPGEAAGGAGGGPPGPEAVSEEKPEKDQELHAL